MSSFTAKFAICYFKKGILIDILVSFWYIQDKQTSSSTIFFEYMHVHMWFAWDVCEV